MKFPIPDLNTIFQIEPHTSLEGIVSIFGDFGVGKTTFTLQTALHTASLGKGVIYIYSKPNFPYDKLISLAKGSHIKTYMKTLDNFILIFPKNFYELYDISYNLEFLVLSELRKDSGSFQLIVTDSITDFYRLELNKERKEKNFELNYQLSQILAHFNALSDKYDIEIFVVNEISRININGKTKEIQSGGKVMDYWAKYTLKMNRTDIMNERKFTLTKHPKVKEIEIKSILTTYGFR